jgi:hypothetical protein
MLLADNSKPDPFDALSAMADGVDISAPSAAPVADTADAAYSDVVVLCPGETQDAPASDKSIAETRAANQVRSTQMAKSQALNHAIQFRKIAMPLLLVVGVLLIAAGAFTLSSASNASPEALHQNALLKNAGLFSGVVFFLAVALIAAAVYFQFDVKRLEAKQN